LSLPPPRMTTTTTTWPTASAASRERQRRRHLLAGRRPEGRRRPKPHCRLCWPGRQAGSAPPSGRRRYPQPLRRGSTTGSVCASEADRCRARRPNPCASSARQRRRRRSRDRPRWPPAEAAGCQRRLTRAGSGGRRRAASGGVSRGVRAPRARGPTTTARGARSAAWAPAERGRGESRTAGGGTASGSSMAPTMGTAGQSVAVQRTVGRRFEAVAAAAPPSAAAVVGEDAAPMAEAEAAHK
jgi:hypothetical protein